MMSVQNQQKNADRFTGFPMFTTVQDPPCRNTR